MILLGFHQISMLDFCLGYQRKKKSHPRLCHGHIINLFFRFCPCFEKSLFHTTILTYALGNFLAILSKFHEDITFF